MRPMYEIEEIDEPWAGFLHPWQVQCKCCFEGCAAVGACIGDALAALPCDSEARLRTWKAEGGGWLDGSGEAGGL